jgi:hypothetical protein
MTAAALCHFTVLVCFRFCCFVSIERKIEERRRRIVDWIWAADEVLMEGMVEGREGREEREGREGREGRGRERDDESKKHKIAQKHGLM